MIETISAAFALTVAFYSLLMKGTVVMHVSNTVSGDDLIIFPRELSFDLEFRKLRGDGETIPGSIIVANPLFQHESLDPADDNDIADDLDDIGQVWADGEIFMWSWLPFPHIWPEAYQTALDYDIRKIAMNPWQAENLGLGSVRGLTLVIDH